VEELEAVASSRNDTIRHLQAQIEDLQLELNNERNQTTSDLLVLSQADAIEDLEEQIRNLKHAHAAQLRSERKQFQQDINELQEDFQLKLDGMRVAAAASPTRAAEAAAAVAPSRSPANVARRAWQRMKRPFQRP
jgi:DNA repair exonuclease SbcCD ATPase subunit